MPTPYSDLLVFERNALLDGEWWRLWSGHLTHFTWVQLLADSGVVAILGYFTQRYLKSAFLMFSLLLAMPVISGLLLWLIPDMNDYRGASAIGALMWVLAGCVFLAECKLFSPHFWLGCLFLLALIIKIAGEALSLLPSLSPLPQGVQVVWQSHLFGAVTGFVLFAAQKRKQGFQKFLDHTP